MPDDGKSLKLIQRAAKRLAPAGTEEIPAASVPPPVIQTPQAAPPRVVETAPAAIAPQAETVHRSNLEAPVAPDAAPRPQSRAAIPSDAANADGRVRLRLGELRSNGMITPDNLSSSIAQEYRAIKRKLLGMARNQKTRVIDNNLVMITSSLPREGKTFTALNLAISLAAERDLHVLLIDGDVIHPRLSGMFEPRHKHGLVELLTGQCRDISEVIHRCSDIPNLSIVFAGQPDVKSPELVSSKRMADICRDVSSRYPDRIVLIDTPPVLASAEPASMAAHVHQILMVVASGHANRAQVQTAIEHVSACRSISLLFNKAPAWSQTETDKYYYYAYHRGASGEQS